MANDVQSIIRRVDAMKVVRGTLNAHLDEIAEFMVPRSVGFSQERVEGDKRMTKIYDATPLSTLNLLAAGLHGMATNPSMTWFQLGMADTRLNDNNEVKRWLADATRIMRAEMYAPQSGITTALNEVYLDLGAFGTAAMFVGQNKRGGLLFQARPLCEVLIAEDDEGVVDTLARRWKESARNIVATWPNAPKAIQDAANKKDKQDEKFELIHYVGPRAGYDPRQRGAKNLPFKECYILVKEQFELEEGGYHEFPYCVPRWVKGAGETYGRSPGMDALPDVKMLNEMMKTTLKAAQKIVDPPLSVPDDGVVGPVRTVPGGLNFFRGEHRIEPILTGGNIPLSLEMMENLRNRIRTTFYVDVLQFVTDTQMTATEVMQRTQERLRLLGPVVGRLESELIGPLIFRIFGLLYRKNIIPRAPDVIQGKPFTVQFVSPIAMAQKQTEANGLAQALQFVLPITERTGSSAVLEPIKFDAIWPWLADRFNVDPNLTYSEEEIAEIRAQAAAKQRAQEAVMLADPATKAMQQGAGAVEKLSKAQQQGADLGAIAGAVQEVAGG